MRDWSWVFDDVVIYVLVLFCYLYSNLEYFILYVINTYLYNKINCIIEDWFLLMDKNMFFKFTSI